MSRPSPKDTPKWRDICSPILPACIADLRAIIDGLPSNVSQADIAMRWFLSTLQGWASDGDGEAQALLHALSEGRPCDMTPGEYTHALLRSVKQWIEYLDAQGRFRGQSKVKYIRRVLTVFELAGTEHQNRYPEFSTALVSVPNENSEIKPLGKLGWPETDGLVGLARDRRCLDLLKADALELVSQEIALHTLGQIILAGGTPGGAVRPRAVAAIKTLLEHEIHSFERTGFSSFSPRGDGERLGHKARLLHRFSDMDLWTDAGFAEGQVQCLDISTPQPPFMLAGVYRLLHPCIGPTPRLVGALAMAFACETGWNPQPIFGMPRQPFLDGIDGGTGVCGVVFLESFKRRAGHTIMGRLLAGGRVPDERLTALWNATVSEVDPAKTGDGYGVLKGDAVSSGGVLEAMRRYELVAASARCMDPRRNAQSNYLFALTRDRGVVVEDFPNRLQVKGRPLGREGANYQAIRISWTNCRYVQVGSVHALMKESGQTSTSVLQRYYLTTPEVKAIYVEHLRFFQDAVQTEVLDRLGDPAVELVMPAEKRDWFRRLATISGIATAMGVAGAGPDADEPKLMLSFRPGADNFKNLYLLHLGLKRCRRVIGYERWLVQGIPLLAAVKAIGIATFKKGYRPAYVRAARSIHRDLALGLVTIPPILEA